MTEKRKYGPYCWVTWLSAIMSGEQSCLWRSWFMTHHQNYVKAKTDSKFTATWNIKHTTLLHKSIHWLKAKDLDVKVEHAFKYTKVPGICLAGKADILATDGKKEVVYDCKSGKPKHSHHVQVMIYMHVLGCDAGHLIYENDHVEVAKPDEAFIESFNRNLRLLAAKDEPYKSPSRGDCRYCPLTEVDCEERVES